MSDHSILITGGAGFIGSHLASRLIDQNTSVSILDNFSTGSRLNLGENFARYRIIDGDIRDEALVANLVEETDIVIHLAAALGVAKIMESPLESMSVNIIGSEVVLRASAKYSKRIIIASTSEIYGKNPIQPLNENSDRVVGSPTNFRWAYSDAKAIEEAMASALFVYEKLPVTTVRFFNTVGPRQTGKYGMVLPRFVASALKNEDLIIHGSGNQTRVFCHVEDAVNAVIRIVNSEKTIGEVFNVGGIGEISINDLADKVIHRSNSKSKKTNVNYSDVYPVGFEDMQRRVPDISKIKKFLNWEPQYGIEKIIDDVIHSQKN
jgi:UDP-glucose 4-epimerase